MADSTAPLQAAIDSLSTQSTPYNHCAPASLYIPPGIYRITEPLVWRAGFGSKIIGAGKWNTKLRWHGAPGVDMLRLSNCRSVDVSGFDLDANGIAASSLLYLETDTTAGDAHASSLNDVHDVILRGSGAAEVGLKIDKSAASDDVQNDYHSFRRLEIADCTVAGIKIRQGQHKGSIFDMCQVGNCVSGLWAPDQGGAFHWLGGFMFNNSAADFTLTSVADAVVISHMGSEGSNRFIDNFIDTGNGWPLTVQGCRWASNGLNADQFMMRLGPCGPYNISGNIFGTTTFVKPRIRVLATTPAAVVLEGNHFDCNDSVDTHPLVLDGSFVSVTRRNNTYRKDGRLMAHRDDEVAAT